MRGKATGTTTLFLAVVAGCTVHLTNVTPDAFKARSSKDYSFCARVKKEGFVISNSIDVDVTIDGPRRQMEGSGVGLWCYAHHAPSATSFEYHYDVSYKYLALFFPVSKTQRFPAEGSYQSTVSPPAPGCTVDGWCPRPSGTTRDLMGIWGSDASDIYAVADMRTLLYYDGSSWSVQTTSEMSLPVDAVWGSGPSHDHTVFAVGFAGVVLTQRGHDPYWTIRWSGSDPSSTDGLWMGELLDIWGFPAEGPNDVSDLFVVADLGKISRFDGSTWSFQASGTEETLRGVWGSSPSDVFAVGSSATILHYDGSSWSAQISPTNAGLKAVWGSGPSDVFAVGGSGTILHYNGTTWTTLASGTSNALMDVWGFGPDDVYAVGRQGTILHYDGSTWSAETSGATVTLNGVWGTMDGCERLVYAVGDDGTILLK
ncbi:MAG: WD40/YVTN/BNR-like repeat-containing protein [Planctomycetota bacterium]|jgi:hypothetical protein